MEAFRLEIKFINGGCFTSAFFTSAYYYVLFSDLRHQRRVKTEYKSLETFCLEINDPTHLTSIGYVGFFANYLIFSIILLRYSVGVLPLSLLNTREKYI